MSADARRRVGDTGAADRSVRDFLDDAHRNGHHGAALLRRWAIQRNHDRRHPTQFVSAQVLDEAIRLEAEADR